MVLAWIVDEDEESVRALHYCYEIAKSAPEFGLDRELDHHIIVD